MKSIDYIFILFLFFQFTHAGGQEKLTLERCRELALQQDQDLRIAGKQVDKAEAEKAALKTMRLPNLSASATGLWMDKDFEMEMYLPTKTPNLTTGELEPNVVVDPSTGQPVTGADGNPVFNMYAWLPLNISLSGAYMAGLSLEQPIYTGGKISAGNKMADIGIGMAHENLKLQEMNTIAEADKAYWTFVSVNEKVKLAERAVEMLDAIVGLVNDSYEVGMVNRNELLKAKVEYNKATLALHKARNGLALSRMDLCRVAGLGLATQIEAVDTIINIGLMPESGNEDITQRPEYRLMSKNIDMQDENIKLTQADYLPVAGVSAGYSRIGGIEFTGEEFSNTSLNVVASLKIPVFHWGEGKKKTASAKIDKEIKELELEKNSQLLQLEIHQARLNLDAAYKRVEIAENALLQAGENLRISNDNFEVGMEKLTDLLTAQTHWQEAYSELIDSNADYKIKETAYLKATGRLGN